MTTYKITAGKRGIYSSGLVVAATEEEAEAVYINRGYKIVGCWPATEYEIEEARIKGMPITEVR